MAKRKQKIVTRRIKEFTYRGIKLDELVKLPRDKLIELLPSRARRTLKRGIPDSQKPFFKNIEKGKNQIKTQRRDIIVLPSMLGKKIGIHHGNGFKFVEIKPEMIGHYLGEFALTRKFIKHGGPGVGATRSSKYLPLK